jgi:hypothetical protein
LLAGFKNQGIHTHLGHAKLAPESPACSTCLVIHIRVLDEAPPRALSVVKSPGTLIPPAEVMAEAFISRPSNLLHSLLAHSGTNRHTASALPWIGLGPDVVRETPPFVSTLA